MKRPSWRRSPCPGAPRGASTGKTKRVVAAAASRPAIENTPSWARPGKPENTSAAKPITEVRRPRRIVGQLSRSQRCAGRPSCRRRRRRAAGARLDQVVDGVVDGFADERRAEAEGHAVHLREAQAHRRDAGEHAGGDGQHGDGQGSQRGEGDDEEGDDQHRAEQGQSLDRAS